MQNNRGKKSINITDVLIVLLAVACVAGVWSRASRISLKKTEGEPNLHRVTFLVSGISASSEKYFKVGDTITVAEGNFKLGTVSGIDSVEATKAYVKNLWGDFVEIEYPKNTKIDVVAVVDSYGFSDEKGFSLADGQKVSPGDIYNARSERMDFVLKVLEIEKN